jgi:adenosylhomocysteine nucleosidase
MDDMPSQHRMTMAQDPTLLAPAAAGRRRAPVAPEARPLVGLLFALGLEARSLEYLLHGRERVCSEGLKVTRGALSGVRAVILRCGVGQREAARGAHALIARYRPDWIVSAGLAGGLQAGLAPGDLILADEILGQEGRRIAPAALGQGCVAALGASGQRMHRGALLTVDRPICRAAEKRALGLAHGALAVDMESLAVAQACADSGTRLLSLRVISDAVDDELPHALEGWLARGSAVRRSGLALGRLIEHPSDLPELLALGRQARSAAGRLAQVLAQVVGRLAGRSE